MTAPDQTSGNSIDDVIAVYARDIDHGALRENLKLTTQERGEKFLRMMELVFELRRNASVKKKATDDEI